MQQLQQYAEKALIYVKRYPALFAGVAFFLYQFYIKKR
jgi:hypothetical protein